jgi:peroxiredoxin
LVKLADTRNLGSRRKLLASINEAISDPDKTIERLGRIGQTELHYIDYLKTVNGDLVPALESSKDLLGRFPDDLHVAAFLESRVIMLLMRQEYDATIGLLQQMLDAYQHSRNLQLEQVAQQAPDRILFVQIRYDKVIEDLRRQRPGAVERYFEAISKIASNPKIGVMAYREVLAAGSYFEQTGQFDHARDLYGLVARKLSFHSDALIAQAAKEDSRLGLIRLDSFGRKVDLHGRKPDGTIVGPTTYADRIVVLYFWPGMQPDQSFRQAVELNETMRQFRGAPVDFLGICVDSDADSRAVETYRKVPNWNLKLEDHLTCVQQLSTDIGIPNRPYVMILDRNGNICAINVSSDKLMANLNELLFKRRDTRQSSTTVRPERSSGGRRAIQ